MLTRQRIPITATVWSAAFMVLLAVGARASEPTVANAFASASWQLNYTWDGLGSGSTVLTFFSDGTFKTSQNGQGRWFQRSGDRRAVFAFAGVSGVPDWSVVYALTVASNGRSFTGIQGWSHTSGSHKGTHVAVRTRFVEDPAELAEVLLASPEDVSATGAKEARNGE